MEFQGRGYNVLLGGSGKSADLLKQTFANIPFIRICSFPVLYLFRGNGFALNILLQLPALICNMISDYLILRKIIYRFSLTMVISDNRYGLRNSKIRSILITHQISPVLPRFMRFAEYPLYLLLRIFVHRFDECWIPDFKGEVNLSGKLSHRYSLPVNAKFIGPLSRFRIKSTFHSTRHYDVVVILSGPQPELKRITKSIIARVNSLNNKTLIICGFQDITRFDVKNSAITMVSHLDPEPLRFALETASLIISTAGYSGITDLFVIGRPAILIPFKGQTEQEYLCHYLQQKKLFISIPEARLDFREINLYNERLELCSQYFRQLNDVDLT